MVGNRVLRGMAITAPTGDPSLSGDAERALRVRIVESGVQLGLPVWHVFEDEVKRACDHAIYAEQLGFFEMTLDIEGSRMRCAERVVRAEPYTSSSVRSALWSSSPPPASTSFANCAATTVNEGIGEPATSAASRTILASLAWSRARNPGS
ncbi:MAG: Glycine reductase complex selenoprotein [Actinomycetota bacterium]|nr:Glycine reductase complex selenoprotein [Actinomycetota bacterium]